MSDFVLEGSTHDVASVEEAIVVASRELVASVVGELESTLLEAVRLGFPFSSSSRSQRTPEPLSLQYTLRFPSSSLRLNFKASVTTPRPTRSSASSKQIARSTWRWTTTLPQERRSLISHIRTYVLRPGASSSQPPSFTRVRSLMSRLLPSRSLDRSVISDKPNSNDSIIPTTSRMSSPSISTPILSDGKDAPLGVPLTVLPQRVTTVTPISSTKADVVGCPCPSSPSPVLPPPFPEMMSLSSDPTSSVCSTPRGTPKRSPSSVPPSP